MGNHSHFCCDPTCSGLRASLASLGTLDVKDTCVILIEEALRFAKKEKTLMMAMSSPAYVFVLEILLCVVRSRCVV